MEGIGEEPPLAPLSSHPREGKQLEFGRGHLQWREATVGCGDKTGNEWKTREEEAWEGRAAGDMAVSGPAMGRSDLLMAAFWMQGPPWEFGLRLRYHLDCGSQAVKPIFAAHHSWARGAPCPAGRAPHLPRGGQVTVLVYDYSFSFSGLLFHSFSLPSNLSRKIGAKTVIDKIVA